MKIILAILLSAFLSGCVTIPADHGTNYVVGFKIEK